jgi:hypothetical protein
MPKDLAFKVLSFRAGHCAYFGELRDDSWNGFAPGLLATNHPGSFGGWSRVDVSVLRVGGLERVLWVLLMHRALQDSRNSFAHWCGVLGLAFSGELT